MQVIMAVPLHAEVDRDLGGRWTTLRTAHREWLWHRADPARSAVAPGDPFVDAGGLEECIPTVRGTPDHGDAWSRPWHETGGLSGLHAPPGDRLAERRRRSGLRTDR
ncbi:hypothetical protein ACFOWZ_24060 [Lentzea rhizosphaerae]|uniref:Uncharacterized protein n=1 Tax=Lentzea rhizosphaerae TaxID=2041025 RepID=A0ABV8BXX5_9PSEU